MRSGEESAERAVSQGSIAARLGLVLALLLAIGAGLIATLAFAYGRDAAQQAYDRLLLGAARQIADAAAPLDGRVVVDLPHSAFELLALSPEDRVVYAVFGPDGRIVTGYDLPRPEQAAEGFHNGEITGEKARFAVSPRLFAERDFAGAVTVVVGQTTRARDALARQITERALVIMGLAGLFMVLLAIFATRSALDPLTRIGREIAGRRPTDLTPITTPVPREIARLVGAMNRFMARLARQAEATGTIIADASHQLRTPIAALRAQAELAAEESDPERTRAIIGRIHDRSVTLSRLTDQMLSRALIIHRADAVPREVIDLRAVAVQATAETDHDLLASAADLELDLPDGPVHCLGDALSLSEASKNLLFNALRHGRAPVAISVRSEAGAAVLAVTDTGPGMPREIWADAATRFARSSGVSRTSAGLGLSIVAEVARAHGGELRFGHTPAGHFEVALALPLAEEAP